MSNKKINFFLVITCQPLTIHYVKRFGLKYLNRYKGNIVFLNLSPLITKYETDNYYKNNLIINYKNYKNINSYKSLFKELSKFKGEFFYMFLQGPHYIISLILALVMRIKKGKKIVLHHGFNPQPNETNLLKLKRFIKKKSLVKLIIKSLYKKSIVFLTTLIDLKPFYFFVSSQHLFDKCFKKYPKKTQRVFSHDSFIYNKIKNKKNLISLSKKKYILFIDQEQENSFENRLLYGSPYIKSNYWERMESFFKFIEKKAGMEVIIAAHHRRMNTNFIKNRKIYKNQTPLLTLHSDIVLTHDSNALNYAVLCKKPIIFLTLNEFNEKNKISAIKKLSRLLKAKIVNIDENYKRKFKNYPLKVSIKNYENYEKTHISFNEMIKVENMWVTIFNKLKNLY